MTVRLRYNRRQVLSYLAALGGLSAGVIMGRGMFSWYAETQMHEYRTNDATWEQDGSYRWRKPYLAATGNRESPLEDWPLITDSWGVVPSIYNPVDPADYTDQDTELVARYQRVSKRLTTVSGGNDISHCLIGDSYFDCMPSYYLINNPFTGLTVSHGAVLSFPGASAESYAYAVDRYVEIMRNYPSHPSGYLVTVGLTPHNDLESPWVYDPHQDTPVPVIPTATEIAPPGLRFTRRGMLKRLSAALLLNERETMLIRSALRDLNVEGDPSHFLPESKPIGKQALIANLDYICTRIQDLPGNGQKVIELVVNPSVYDAPEEDISYGWDEFLKGYQQEKQREGVTVQIVDVRSAFRKIIQRLSIDYNNCFHPVDRHYSDLGRRVFAIALAQARHGIIAEALPQTMEWLMQQHAFVMYPGLHA